MPSYLVENGIKQEISNDMFDYIHNMICTPSNSETSNSSDETEEVIQTNWRHQTNGYYNSKPIDENYFKKYYQEKTKKSCMCEICCSTISCRSNLAKHKKTKKCMSFLH